jgi:hypothetical protein
VIITAPKYEPVSGGVSLSRLRSPHSPTMPAGPAERAPLMGGAPSPAAGARAYGDRARGMRVLKDNLRVMPTSVAGASTGVAGARAPSAAERRGAGGLCNSAGVLPPLRLRARAGLALGVCGLGITWQTAAEYLLAGSERASRACASCTASVAPASACMWQHACATHTVHAPAPHTRAHW